MQPELATGGDISHDFVIALDDDHDPGNQVGHNYDGSRDAPIWALKVTTDTDDEEHWGQEVVVRPDGTRAEGLTYAAALEIARELAASGSYTWPPIGYPLPDES